MTVETIRDFSRDLLDTNSTEYTDAKFLKHINIKYGMRILDMLRVATDPNASLKYQKTTLISTSGLSEGDLGYNGEYPFPGDHLEPIRIEISYDGTDYKPAKFYDITESDASEKEEADIQANFSQSEPHVRFERESYFVRPLKTSTGNITGGIHIWYKLRQTALALDADSPTFEANLHNLLAYDCAEIQALKRKGKYDQMWWSNFRRQKTEAERVFFEYYKNRFRPKFRIDTNTNSPGMNYA